MLLVSSWDLWCICCLSLFNWNPKPGLDAYFFPQHDSRTTIKQYQLVRNRNLLGHDDNQKNLKELWSSVCLIFSCDQAALWMVQSVRLSVCPSVRPSVCHTFLTMFPSSYHHEIFRSYYQWQKWRPCKRSRSKVKVTEVTTQLNRFRTVTPVWIHIWWWDDAYSLIMLRRGALLFFKVIRRISRSQGSKNRLIWPRFGISGL